MTMRPQFRLARWLLLLSVGAMSCMLLTPQTSSADATVMSPTSPATTRQSAYVDGVAYDISLVASGRAAVASPFRSKGVVDGVDIPLGPGAGRSVRVARNHQARPIHHHPVGDIYLAAGAARLIMIDLPLARLSLLVFSYRNSRRAFLRAETDGLSRQGWSPVGGPSGGVFVSRGTSLHIDSRPDGTGTKGTIWLTY
jgi:hypothetical protein